MLTVVFDRLRRFRYSSRGRMFFSTAKGCDDVLKTPLILRRNELPRCKNGKIKSISKDEMHSSRISVQIGCKYKGNLD